MSRRAELDNRMKKDKLLLYNFLSLNKLSLGNILFYLHFIYVYNKTVTYFKFHVTYIIQYTCLLV